TCSRVPGRADHAGASSAISGNPAVRNTSITCCLVSCTATTELSTSCEIAFVRDRRAHPIQLPAPWSGHCTVSPAAIEPPLGPGPLNAPDLLCVLVVDGRGTDAPRRS